MEFFRKKRLVDVVVKQSSNPLGTPAKILDDLAFYSSNVESSGGIMNEEPLRLMAYGYARRICAAALFVDGFYDKSAYLIHYEMWGKIQDITNNTPEFQTKALDQAVELIQSYKKDLTKELLLNIVKTAEN